MDKTVLYNLSYGMYIVSTKDGERDVGCVVNSIFQVTSSPSTLAVSINKDNYTNPCILKAGKFVVSILSEKTTPDVIGLFGFSSSRDKDKFAGIGCIPTESGIPAVDSHLCGYIECKVISQTDCFTHTVIIAEITNAVSVSEEVPMTYGCYRKVIKGKSPKNAPTYIEPEPSVQENPEEYKYVCSICGYVYSGSNDEFEALADSYECPLCSSPKALFVKEKV